MVGCSGEEGKQAQPMMASLAAHANGDLLRKTSSGLRVMLGRDSLEFPASRSPSGTLQVRKQPHYHT